MSNKTKDQAEQVSPCEEKTQEVPKSKKRKRRWGDRADGRKLRTIIPLHRIMPYIMPKRSDAQNYFSESFDLSKVDEFCRKKVKEGYTNFGFLHVLVAAYVRMISQHPQVNRFISGQKVYSRDYVDVVMAVKKEMLSNAPETCIKVHLTPYDTVDDVYRKFNEVIESVVGNTDESGFDKLAKVINYIPGIFLRWTVKLLNFFDYLGWLPRWLTNLSPFHGSLIVTSMGSLGIQPIYHHIYDFGNLPVFISYGKKRTERYIDENGNVRTRRMIDMKVVTDERICDGYCFAMAFKMLKRYVEDPERLVLPPEKVIEDID